ncbi:MAG: hypothetical protein MJZ45_00390 [Bacteroidales bacterium]|nr:hypothetical protein [Bacteroidales bacterium]
MTRIFIEAKHKNTTESVFITTLLKYLGIEASSFEICWVDGKDNLIKNEVKFRENTLMGGRNIIIFDADTPSTGCGYTATRERILSTFPDDVIIDDLYLFPHNHDDGIFENLLEDLALKDVHSKFFDCFNDYELCLGDKYVSPDLKGKLHTYMSAQKSLSNTQRKALGSGQCLFDDKRFWNFDVVELQPLKDFLAANVR